MITFKDTQLALIHIPLPLYHNFLQAILQLVLPNATRNGYENGSGAVQPPKGWPCEHPFVNISITPVECSIVCSRTLARELFVPVLNLLDLKARESVNITTEDFVVMQVDGEGLDAGQRVLELTSPLALAGMWVPSSVIIKHHANILQSHLLHYHILLRLHPCTPSTSITGR